MIKPGWKRDTCPQCHMPGRLGADYEKSMKIIDPRFNHYIVMAFNGPRNQPWTVKADICINCGVMYAYECMQTVQPMDPTITSTDRLKTDRES